MKKLKNWFIGFKTIKGGAAGLINIADYIYNDKHKNHVKNGHEIVAFEAGNSEKILQNILHIQQSKENKTLLKRKMAFLLKSSEIISQKHLSSS